MDGVGVDPSPGPAPASGSTPAPSWRLTSVGASGLTAASIVLLLLYLTGRFLWLYNKDAAAAAAVPASAAASSTPAASSLPAARPRHGRVPLPQLPVVVVHVGSECAVCLAEFGDGEAGRALPQCGHGGFHDECISTWLRVNTTCPLCRAPVAAK